MEVDEGSPKAMDNEKGKGNGNWNGEGIVESTTGGECLEHNEWASGSKENEQAKRPIRDDTSAKCNSVREPYAILPGTMGDLSSASKYFQKLPDPAGAKQSAIRLCKSILTCS
jgi:hypothetical protein